MNAIAKAVDGTFIDPFNGERDITDRIIRHVGPAFSEDPLRILRVARFAARYPDFKIAPETLKLMKDMVHSGALNELSSERVIGELDKSLKTESPSRFFEVLRQVDADVALFSHEFHVEKISAAFEGIDSSRIDNSWLFSLAFERSGLSLFQTTSLGIRYKLPKEYSQNLQMLQHFEKVLVVNPLDPNTHWDIFLKADGVRRPERFVDFLNLLETQHPLCFAGVKDAVGKVQTIHFGESLKNIPPPERATYVNEARKGVFLSTWFSELTKKRKP
jgi:tRNA nucleotidyltransferase (CCA-adding enzyme)